MRIACLNKVQELKPSIEDVNQLRLFPLLDRDETISELQKEIPAYLAETNGVKIDDASQLLWWSNKQNSLPNWSATAKLLALVQLTSAAAEHVFSILRTAFNDKQAGALEDYLIRSVMLAYHYRQSD